jgi:hypothetical protein
MSVNLPNWYARQYSTNIQLKLQAMGSILRPYVTEGSYVGDQASPVDFMGSVEMQDVTQRFAPMGRVDAATDRRWVFPVDSDLPQMVDSFDKLRLLTDPESKMVENGVIAAGRRLDKHILNAFFADAKTGVAGAVDDLVHVGQRSGRGGRRGEQPAQCRKTLGCQRTHAREVRRFRAGANLCDSHREGRKRVVERNSDHFVGLQRRCAGDARRTDQSILGDQLHLLRIGRNGSRGDE